jgi:hypothetical protein
MIFSDYRMSYEEIDDVQFFHTLLENVRLHFHSSFQLQLHEIQSRVARVRHENENKEKLREKLANGDKVFKYINRKSGEVGSIPAIRVGDTYVQGKEAVHLCRVLWKTGDRKNGV